MLKWNRLCSWMFTLPVFLLFQASDAGAATAEETLAKINRLPPAERQAALIKEAKNEKTVVWYAAMNREDLRQFTSGFEAEYPFLKVEVLTSGPQSLLNRILTEHRAGKYNYDTLNIRSSALYTLKKANVIMRYDTPYRRGLRAGFYDKEGYFNGIWASLLVYLFNAKQVTRAQAPKSIDDRDVAWFPNWSRRASSPCKSTPITTKRYRCARREHPSITSFLSPLYPLSRCQHL